MESKVFEVIQGKDELRTQYLMRVAATMLRNNAYSIDTIRYDEADCDALRLADDLESEIEESTLIREHQLMKEALERIQNSMQRFDFRKCARETLKQIML